MLHENERIDDLHRNGYRIIQREDGFCFGEDAVLLSGFAKVRKGEKVLDLCTGTGVIPILLEAKTEGSRFSAIEIQEEIADMARRSVELNSLEEKIDIVTGDIKECMKYFRSEEFDVVTCNPPYMKVNSGYINESSPKALARHEILCSIDDVFDAAFRTLKYGGRMYMIHRCERLADIICSARQKSIEPKLLRFVVPYAGRAPELMLMELIKGGKPGLKIMNDMVIYSENGVYTEEVYDIYYK